MIRSVVIAASASGLDLLKTIIGTLPVRCAATIFVVVHIGRIAASFRSCCPTAARSPAVFPQDGDTIEAGQIYVAPPDHHMFMEPRRIRLDRGVKVHHARPAADPLFISAAETRGPLAEGTVLSGGDGAAGLRAIVRRGAIPLVQAPSETLVPEMPYTAIMKDHPDACLSVANIGRWVSSFCA